ncbi:hypothetical protein BC835DRAFT_1352893 [Cytidiella melzeri]|nr:hypothetical protein BC835DRAFT_1352893 [Cytidiella melzeri]
MSFSAASTLPSDIAGYSSLLSSQAMREGLIIDLEATSYLESTAQEMERNSGTTLMDVEEDATSPWVGSPVRRADRVAHLPTPQSPNNIGAYVDTLTFGVDSPIRSSSRESRVPTAFSKQRSPKADQVEVLASLITPESSPVFVRRSNSTLATSSTSLPSTPTRKTQIASAAESLSALARTAGPSTPTTPHSPNTSIPSVLSSPFVDRIERQPPNRVSSRHSPESDLADCENMVTSLASTPPPLPAPIPQRAAQGEMTRLRLQIAAEQAALMQEAESRRPDYLKRTKRPLSDHEDDVIINDLENTASSTGVMDSPVKGRRLALFQATSEESFEQSLLAGGYPSYGHTPAYGEPSTPHGSVKPALSQRAMDWLQQASPGQQTSPQTPSPNDESEPVETEQDSGKRRRLSAFRDYSTSDSYKKLYPVEMEGHGRVLVDQLPDELSQQVVETPSKRRGNARRKRGGVQDSPSRKRTQLPDSSDDVVAGLPNWLDQVFPWSTRVQERKELAQKEEEHKLKWIERYLERDSDEDDEEDQSLGLPAQDLVDPPLSRGRGKMVPLLVNPAESKQSTSKRNSTYYPSDPADARAALLSKRSVRALAFRRQQEIVCICRGKDDGRELVQCDDCKEWFHLECIGIKDISDLGREEDPWYCMDCLGIPSARSSSPTFVPTDDRPTAKPRRDPLFYQGSTQESPPGISWRMPGVPKTPSRGSDLVPQLSSRSSWDDSSSPTGPRTPSTLHRSARAYATPKANITLEESFDPLSTPSRGMHISGPFTTPKPPAFWATRAYAMQTPSRPAKRQTAPWAFDNLQDDSSPYRPVYDDSPVRRSQPQPQRHLAATRYVQESPLAVRSASIPGIGRSRSPLFGKSLVDRTHNRSALG